MEFRFRAGDRPAGRSPSPARFSRPCDRRYLPRGPFHGELPPPSPFEWEAAAWRERIIREEVERRLICEEVERRLIEEASLIEEEVRRELAVARARFGGAFGRVPFVGSDGPFVPPGAFFGPHGPFLPPVPPPLMPASFGRVGFEQSILVKRRPLPPPKLKPKHRLKVCETETSKNSEVWKKHLKRKLALYGASVAASVAGPSDAHKKIHILVDGEMHEVVQQGNYVWCERCSVRCINAATMADHLRGKKHSLLNRVWRSIKAVRMKNKSKEDTAATCEGKVNDNGQ
ncbi:hypothetical protein SETIT_4G195100v2 [Setaria italica]|uniref:C2H2-type domain-containing protein n=1 Tax=Setaria italica TaxID=4555 RepID=A0A368QXU3_SETIT|nr:hypothetical protein SETIT_4G195100v2 [Setaria italica]